LVHPSNLSLHMMGAEEGEEDVEEEWIVVAKVKLASNATRKATFQENVQMLDRVEEAICLLLKLASSAIKKDISQETVQIKTQWDEEGAEEEEASHKEVEEVAILASSATKRATSLENAQMFKMTSILAPISVPGMMKVLREEKETGRAVLQLGSQI